MENNIDKKIEDINERLNLLEKAVFSIKTKSTTKSSSNFKGPAGGIDFLISKGFFSTPKTRIEAYEELKENGYHYHIDVIQTAMTRKAVAGGPLVTFIKNRKKVYAERK